MYIQEGCVHARSCVCARACLVTMAAAKTYQRPQNHTGVAGAARVVPKNNPCQRWHERRKSEAGGNTRDARTRARAHTHTLTHTQVCPFTRRLPLKAQAHTLDFLPFFLAEDSHGSGRRNPFSTDAGTAVLILNETQLVLPLSVCS